MIKLTLKCEQCGDPFEHITPRKGSKKRFCDDCLEERHKKDVKKYTRKVFAFYKKWKDKV